MNLYSLPWLELTILVPAIGAVLVWACRDAVVGARLGLGFTAAALGCAVMVLLGFFTGGLATPPAWSLLPATSGPPILAVDELSAPLLPLFALLHFLIVLATTGAKSARFSFAGLLGSESVRMAMFAVNAGRYPWALIALLAVNAVPPLLELRFRGKPTRVYALHMFVFIALLALGWAFVESDQAVHVQPAVACVLLLVAVLIRSGTVPGHLWVADLFEHASFGAALLFVTPMAGVYAAVRLILPVCPGWVLQGIVLFSLVTAVYAAGMAVIQNEARRFFAYVFLSHASLVLVGLELSGSGETAPVSLTGALALWFSVALSLSGLGLTLRAVEARFGRLSLTEFRGLYEHSPALAVCFLVTGLASVGFPGTLGFVAAEVLVDGAIGANLAVGVTMVLAAALNGIAVVRAYFMLFTGGRHLSEVPLGITPRERFAVLTLAFLLLGGGIMPQPGIASRHRAAEAILKERNSKLGQPELPSGEHSH